MTFDEFVSSRSPSVNQRKSGMGDPPASSLSSQGLPFPQYNFQENSKRLVATTKCLSTIVCIFKFDILCPSSSLFPADTNGRRENQHGHL